PYDDWAKSIKKVLKDPPFIICKGTEYFLEVIENLQARHEEWCKSMTPPSVQTGISKIVLAMEEDLETNQEKGRVPILLTENKCVKSSSKFTCLLPKDQFSNCPGTTIANPLSYLRRYEEKRKQVELKKDDAFYQNVLNIIQSPSEMNFASSLTEKGIYPDVTVKSEENNIYEDLSKDKTPPIIRTSKQRRCPKTIVLNPLDFLQKCENRNKQKNYEYEAKPTIKSSTSNPCQTNIENAQSTFNLSSNSDSNFLQTMALSEFNPNCNQKSNIFHPRELLNKSNQNEYNMTRSPLLSNQTLAWKSIKQPSFQTSDQPIQFSNKGSLPVSSHGFNVDYKPDLTQNTLPNNLKLSYHNQSSNELSYHNHIFEQTMGDNCMLQPIQNILETKSTLDELCPASKYCQGAERLFPINIRSVLDGGSKRSDKYEIQQPTTTLCPETVPDFSQNYFHHISQQTHSLPSTSLVFSTSNPILKGASDNLTTNNELFINTCQSESNKKVAYYTACTPEISGPPAITFGELILHKRNKSTDDTSSGTLSMQSSQENTYYENNEKASQVHTQPTINFGPIERGIFGHPQQNQQQSYSHSKGMNHLQYPGILAQHVTTKHCNQPHPELPITFLSCNDLQNHSTESKEYENSRMYSPKSIILNQTSQAGTYQPHQNSMHQHHSMQSENNFNLQPMHFIHPYQKTSLQYEANDIAKHSMVQARHSNTECYL
ncbi:unnamed protein product, partial [Meganyctiphanes norvegica]